jgi:GWxTD domain-containing protein
MMFLDTLVKTPLASAAGWTLIHLLWEGAIVAFVLAAALSMIRSAEIRYLAATFAMLLLLVCFAATFVEMRMAQGPANSVKTYNATRLNFPNPAAGSPSLPIRNRLENLPPWTAPFWIAGVLILSSRHLRNWTAARALRRTGVCSPPDVWQQRLTELAARVRVSRPVLLLESSLAGVPSVVGHLRPVILMPVGLLTSLPVAQIETILAHELAHIRRHDYLVNMLQVAMESLLFYHPAVWWISGIMRAEREHCCDDMVVASGGDAYQYALALATLEETRSSAPQSALAATGGNLMERIQRLLYPMQKTRTALMPLLSVPLLMMATTVGLVAWQEKAPVQASGDSPYTKWLNEDVAYIISNAERVAFLDLQTDAERIQFIDQFWLRRDPTPGTPQNEYRDEHYRRIAYTNDRFTTLAGKAGWKTDRGRIYIQFGPPDELETHPIGDGTFAYEKWRYRYIQGIGNDVNMEFRDRNNNGDFQMTQDPNPPPGRRLRNPQ